MRFRKTGGWISYGKFYFLNIEVTNSSSTYKPQVVTFCAEYRGISSHLHVPGEQEPGAELEKGHKQRVSYTHVVSIFLTLKIDNATTAP